MAGDHDHSHGVSAARRAGAAYRRRLTWAFGLIAGYFFVELVAGLLTNSLALLSDAGHMFTDVLGMGMALAAIHVADRGSRDTSRTFGLYRLEILAALANAALLLGVAVYILVEAVQRLFAPADVVSTPMLVVAVVGLVINLVAFQLLRAGARESLNIEGAYLEVLADTLGSVGVVIAALAIEWTGATIVDPIMAVAIGLFVLPRTWRLARKALRIIIQAAPPHIAPADLAVELSELEGVDEAHDLHVWTLTSGMEVASVHLRLVEGADSHAVLDRARTLLRSGHDIDHATIQVEPAAHANCLDCEQMRW